LSQEVSPVDSRKDVGYWIFVLLLWVASASAAGVVTGAIALVLPEWLPRALAVYLFWVVSAYLWFVTVAHTVWLLWESYFPLPSVCGKVHALLSRWTSPVVKPTSKASADKITFIGRLCGVLWLPFLCLNILITTQILETFVPYGQPMYLGPFGDYRAFALIMGFLWGIALSVFAVKATTRMEDSRQHKPSGDKEWERSREVAVSWFAVVAVCVLAEAAGGAYRSWLIFGGELARSPTFIDAVMQQGGVFVGAAVSALAAIAEATMAGEGVPGYWEHVQRTWWVKPWAALRGVLCGILWLGLGFHHAAVPAEIMDLRAAARALKWRAAGVKAKGEALKAAIDSSPKIARPDLSYSDIEEGREKLRTEVDKTETEAERELNECSPGSDAERYALRRLLDDIRQVRTRYKSIGTNHLVEAKALRKRTRDLKRWSLLPSEWRTLRAQRRLLRGWRRKIDGLGTEVNTLVGTVAGLRKDLEDLKTPRQNDPTAAGANDREPMIKDSLRQLSRAEEILSGSGAPEVKTEKPSKPGNGLSEWLAAPRERLKKLEDEAESAWEGFPEDVKLADLRRSVSQLAGYVSQKLGGGSTIAGNYRTVRNDIRRHLKNLESGWLRRRIA
jgi:hypothetical protein